MLHKLGCAAVVTAALALGAPAREAAQLPVRHAEGLVHGFLAVRDLNGKTLADGDLIQNAVGSRVTSRLVFHFRDGSVQDETAVFSENGEFRLVSDHIMQRGPAFPRALDMRVDGSGGNVTVRYEDNGEQKTATDRVGDVAGLANGLVLTLLKNANGVAPSKPFVYVAATPKPRVVKLAVRVVGKEPFSTGGVRRTAVHYALEVEIGGLAGLLAPVFGKQPPDSHVWILEGEAPAFVKAEQQFYYGGPIWRIELVSPTWPSTPRG